MWWCLFRARVQFRPAVPSPGMGPPGPSPASAALPVCHPIGLRPDRGPNFFIRTPCYLPPETHTPPETRAPPPEGQEAREIGAPSFLDSRPQRQAAGIRARPPSRVLGTPRRCLPACWFPRSCFPKRAACLLFLPFLACCCVLLHPGRARLPAFPALLVCCVCPLVGGLGMLGGADSGFCSQVRLEIDVSDRHLSST